MGSPETVLLCGDALEELPKGGRLNAQRIKLLAGTNELSGRKMRMDFRTFHATHTLVGATNHLPIITDVDDASPALGRIATPRTGGPDIILSIEGVTVTTPDALKAALQSAKPGDIVSLRIYNMPAKSRRIERIRLTSSADR